MQHKVIDTKDVVIRFAGDSGDGMQLTGSLFADMSAIYGNELSTFPDYPAEIRAPHGTVSGVSGFQVHIGSGDVNTPGDFCDLLVAMNPAALKANAKWCKPTAMILVDVDAFDEAGMKKAGFKTDNPFEELHVEDRTIIADYFVIATGSSRTQIRALADEIEFRLEPYGIAPHHIEGADTGVWVLEDFGPVIVHLFNSEGREFYNLDKLYQDTTERDISELITED